MRPSRTHNLLNEAYALGANSNDPEMGRTDNRQRLTELIREQEKPLVWIEAQKISNVPIVDTLLRDFTEDPTADAATILVQTIVAAYLKG